MVDSLKKYDVEKMIDDVLILDKVLGSGAQSQVRLGRHSKSGQIYAIKIIGRLEDPSKNSSIDEYTQREIEILKKISHQNIVQLYSVKMTERNIYMVFEYCNGETLSQYLQQNQGRLSLQDSLGVLSKICDAFQLLSKNKIMHRDIKPDNIMFHDGELKIVDFGFARLMDTTEPRSYTRCGTPFYMCPQILNNERYSWKCDIWSTGVMMFRIFTGEHPFIPKEMSPIDIKKSMNSYKLLEIINKNLIKWELFDDCPVIGIRELLMKMLQIQERDRCSWEEVILAKNEFLKKFGQITMNYLKSVSPQNKQRNDGLIIEGNTTEDINSQKFFPPQPLFMNKMMSIEDEKKTSFNAELLDNQLSILISFLNFEKKLAANFQTIAGKLYWNIQNNSAQVDRSIVLILLYLTFQVSILKLKNILSMMNQKSLLKAYLVENEIYDNLNLEELAKNEVYEQFRLEVLEEMQVLEDHAKEVEATVIKDLQKRIAKNKIGFFTQFLQSIESGYFQDFSTTFIQLCQNATEFIEYYKKDLPTANFEFLITFRLLQIVGKWRKMFKWDAENKKEGNEFDGYYEGLKTMQKGELLKIILNDIPGKKN